MNFASTPSSQKRWRGSGQATDDYVLRCRTFQEHGVNEGIAHQAGDRQNSRQNINGER